MNYIFIGHYKAEDVLMQRASAASAKSLLTSAILENLDIEHSSRMFAIADLGCSTGPNTFMAVENIIEALTQKCKIEDYSSLPEFQVHFNDHVSNDFNTLFANLPSDRKYFASGVPGSFHGRLFPKATLNIIYSAFSLQWLSKAPQELGDVNSPAWNKGRIYYTDAPREVGQAYSLQYAKDMESFLAARAEELAPGGLLLILMPGRPDGTLPSQNSLGPFLRPLESCLTDMVDEEIICDHEIDSFNMPLYSPSIEELRKLIEKNGCFGIARLETLPPRSVPLPSAEECRSGFESILRKHFRSEIIEQLFERYTAKIAGQPPVKTIDGFAIGLFVILKRNV
ncbi:hypothetical protein DKX38_011543 [Salix brachista]|uniref:Uncharacterized protein n=1 Tax=Salix brachista TaxID=2182728 RepID=A0A5N5LZA8_9ROSI|nr:hypothetical protein DKX38_011543 [Salix brachista]